METEADVKWFNGKPSNSSAAAIVVQPEHNDLDVTDRALPLRVVFNKYDMYYDMTGEKRLLIFNHYKYEKTMYFEFKRPSQRNNTEKDVKSLQDTFRNLGFKTIVHNDLYHADILKKVSEVCKEDHRATSCVVVAIMTHGDDGAVYAADRPYRLSDVTNILHNSHPSLVGKPKLIFVQACRGENMDDGRRVQTDGGENIVLPTHADMLIMLSSAENDLAYRDADGPCLMQSLCDILDEYHPSYDLFQMTTFVNQVFKKMVPETTSRLTKLLKL